MADVVQIAKQIRKELKEKFPFAKFSVRSSRYSGGSSVHVSWNDFPTQEAVEKITNKYKQVRYDEYTGEILSGGNLFVITQNKWSDELRNKIETEMKNNYSESYLNDQFGKMKAFNETAEKLYNEFLQSLKQPKEVKQEQQTNVKATYTLNEELNGIEIAFNTIPSEEIRNELKSYGFKWSKYKKVWYAKQTAERLEFAKMLAGETEQKTEKVTDQPKAQQESVNVNNNQQEKTQGVFTFIPEVHENDFNLQFFSSPTSTEDVLSMFNSIDFTQGQNSIITADDRRHCEELERQLQDVLNIYQSILSQLQHDKKDNKYICKFDDIRLIQERIEKAKNSFIHDVIGYFTNKYKVDIDSWELVNKYKGQPVTLDMIIDEIITILDGLTFAELKAQQIKDYMKKSVRYKKITLKNNKVSINSYFFVSFENYGRPTYKLDYGQYNKITALFKAIAHYNNVDYKQFEELENILKRKYNDDVFTTHELNMKKIKSIKLYKNGRVDIEFTSNNYAKEFAKDFLNIVKTA